MIHLRLNNLNFPAENETQNHRKSRIQRFERSELRLHFEWPKLKKPKMVNLASFWKSTVLPDRSVLIGQKYHNSKIQMWDFGSFSNNMKIFLSYFLHQNSDVDLIFAPKFKYLKHHFISNAKLQNVLLLPSGNNSQKLMMIIVQ